MILIQTYYSFREDQSSQSVLGEGIDMICKTIRMFVPIRFFKDCGISSLRKDNNFVLIIDILDDNAHPFSAAKINHIQ